MGKYDFDLDIDEKNDSHSIILRQIEKGSTVLEFGCFTGIMTKFMKYGLDCDVYIAEIDPLAFEQAREYAVDGYCGDIEEGEWRTKFDGIKFDYIIFADVLEHLKHPQKTLQKALELLKEGGRAIVSVPNIAYSGVLAELYLNQFQYRETGILDATHLHMFSYETLQALFLDCKLELLQMEATYHPLENTEFGYLLNKIPGHVLSVLQQKKLSTVYQLILTGIKGMEKTDKKSPHTFKNNLNFDNMTSDTMSIVVSGDAGVEMVRHKFEVYQGEVQIEIPVPMGCKAALIQLPGSFGMVLEQLRFQSDTRDGIAYRNIHGVRVGIYDILLSAHSAIEVLLENSDGKLTIIGRLATINNEIIQKIQQSVLSEQNAREHTVLCKEAHINQLIESERTLQWKVEQLDRTVEVEKSCIETIVASHTREIESLEQAYELKIESQAMVQANVLTMEKERYAHTIDAKTREYEKGLEEKEYFNASVLAEKEAQHSEALMKQDAQHSQAMAEQEEQHSVAMAEQEEQHNTAMAEQEEQHSTAMAEQEEQHSTAMAEQEVQHDQAMAKQEGKHNQILAQQNTMHAKALAEQEQVLVATMEQKEAEWATTLHSKEETFALTLNNKEGHINLLLESDRELERIKNSRSWRMMGKVWKIRDVLIPRGSKRRLFGKMVVKFVKHPIRFLRKATPSRIGKFFKTLKREGALATSSRMDDCLIGTTIPTQVLSITEVPQVETVVGKTVHDYQKLRVPTWQTPQVSIVIPVYNQFDYTYHCIESILRQSGKATYEIIIGDDGSSDLTTQLEQVIEGVTLVRNPENLRFLRNCNHAAQFAKGEHILFLNNDTQVQENWLIPLIDLMEGNEQIGMVGSKLVYPDGRLQEAGGILWKDGSAWNYGHRSDPADPEYNYVKEVDYISGAAIMIRKSLWLEIGGFDEHFVPAYYEDTDLAFEVRKHGYQVVYQPLSVVVHFEGISNGTDLSSGQKAYQQVNAKKFFEKWKDVLEANHFPNAEDVYLAKDRSQQKKRVLVVDHYVPHHDKDAGGKCTYMYIKLFLALGMKVTFIGDNYFPHQPYTTELQQLGVEVLYGDYYYLNWKSWLKENAHYFEYFYLNRPHISIKYMDLIRANSKGKIIYFGHDLHYLREYRQYLIDHNPETLKQSQASKEREFTLFNKADVVYTVGSYEQEVLQKEFPEKPIRNIPVYIYDDVRPSQEINTDFETRKDIIFVGGFGHTPNVDAVEWFAEHVFPEILAKIPDIKWYIVGSKPPQSVLDLKSDHIIVTGFISDEELANLYDTCRLAVVPLRVGAGVKGKVVEANYCGIPLVTTPIGAEGLSLEEEAFVVCEPEPSMAEVIVETYQDFEQLNTLSKQSQVFIQHHFTLDLAKQIVQKDIDLG